MTISLDQFYCIFGGQPVPTLKSSYISWDDLGIIEALLKAFRCRRIVEIGAGTGANAKLLLAACPWIEKYVGIDVPPGTVPALAYQRFEVPQECGHLALHDDRYEAWVSPKGSVDVEPARLAGFDFVFVDGDHSLEGVLYDTMLARAVVSGA
jgi:predicted O-methyltransferase YrrM